MAPLVLDVTLTCAVQDDANAAEFVRGLAGALGRRGLARPVVHAGGAAWRALTRGEERRLADSADARPPSLVAGVLRRVPGLRARAVALGGAGGFVEAEVPSAAILRMLPALLAATPGPHIAVFHGAAALRDPQRHHPSLVERLPLHLRGLRAFHGVACVSAEAAAELTGFWDWLGEPGPRPELVVLPRDDRTEAGWDRVAGAVVALVAARG